MVPLSWVQERADSGSVLSRNFETKGASSFSNPLQQTVDGLVGRFLEEAFSPITLSALLAGSSSYRLIRLGVSALGEGRLASASLRWMSVAAGLFSEVVAFEFANRTLLTLSPHPSTSSGQAPDPLAEGEGGASYPQGHRQDTLHTSRFWSWSGQGGWKEGLLSTGISLSLLKGAAFLGRQENGIVRHLFQSSALVAGHHVASRFGLIPKQEGNLGEQLLHAEVLNFQWTAGSSLLSFFTPRLFYWERALDLQRKGRDSPILFFPISGVNSFVFSSATFFGAETKEAMPVVRTIPVKEKAADAVLSSLSRPMASRGSGEEGSGETLAERKAEREKLHSLFRDSLHRQFTYEGAVADLIDSAMEIPSRLGRVRRHFLASLTHSRLADPPSAYLMALTLREVFRRNPLYSSLGSYHEALLQLFAESALKDSSSGRTGFALRSLYQTLAHRPSSKSIEELLDHYGYAEEYRLNPSEISLQKQELLTRFSSEDSPYPMEPVLRALEFSSQVKFSKVVLDRLSRIFDSNAHLSKIGELSPVPAPDLGKEVFEKVDETRFDSFRGSFLTAFVDDLRLAFKVASVLKTEYQYRTIASDRILKNRGRLESKAKKFLEVWQALSPGKIMELLGVNGGWAYQRMKKDWNQKFSIEVLSSENYEVAVKEGDLDFKGSLVSVLDPEGVRPRILVRDLSYRDRSDLESQWNAFRELSDRLSGVVQKWDMVHQLQTEVPFQVLNPSFPTVSSSFHSRLARGMMAGLEEQRWRLINGLPMEWELADRMGGMVFYLRNRQEQFLGREP